VPDHHREDSRIGAGAVTAQVSPAVSIVDCDVHEVLPSVEALFPHLSPAWQQHITRYEWKGVGQGYPYGAPAGGYRLDTKGGDGPAGSSLEAMRAQLLDAEGVSVAILNGFFHLSSSDGWYELMVALASAYNDWQIEQWLDREPRLRGSVHVVAHDPAAAAREIDRVGEHPQVVQVFLPASVSREYGDPFYRPIFEAAVRRGLAVALHHGEQTRTVLGYPRYFVEWHTAIPHAHMCQLTSLVCNGVFDQLPDLKVVILEAGCTWMPHLMWRLDQQYRELRSEVPWVRRLPSEHLRACVRMVTHPMEDISARQLVQVVDMVGSEEMFLFASDYPHWDYDSPHSALPSPLPEALKQAILGGNALRTYRL
jgi:predicted TIM-barrel fold metal-dependent hydrolase